MRFPNAEVEFESTGVLHDPAQRDAAVDLLASSRATDVLLLAHGWNADIAGARRLFEGLTDSVAAVRGRVPRAAARRIAVIGLLWPSLRWADDDDLAGGGAGVGDEQANLQQVIAEAITDPAAREQLQQLVPHLDSSADARKEFLEALRAELPAPVDGDEEPPPTALLSGDTEQVFDEVSGPDVDLLGPDSPGGAADFDATPLAAGGGAAAFGFGGFLRGARALLNLTTYYTMKQRAFAVGTRGVADLLDVFEREAPDARYHLAGHSFGARVVSAALTQHPSAHSVILLQGAFSHHGFASNYDDRSHDGLFRSVLSSRQLTGPVLVTHTRNDKPVGLAYAIASRLARQAASGLGGPDDLYGGIGRNGALKTPEAIRPPGKLLDVGQDYAFTVGKVYNLQADTFIRSHSAVTGHEVAYALLTALSS